VSYRLSDRAQADLVEIWDYSAEQWGVDQADRYIDALITRFRWLGGNAALWKLRSDLASGLYSYPQQSHAIYFRVCADVSDAIEIVRVLHGRMEPARHVG
jgi:toxin ParE1/3/4